MKKNIRNWLWDRKISIKEVKCILSKPLDERFISTAALLFSRNNSPQEVFKEYISPVIFCRYWHRIKKRMRRDKWNNPRIELWQAIYEKVYEKLKKKGIVIKPEKITQVDEFFKEVGVQIRTIRLKKNMTQKKFAKKVGVSQQMISHIEKGKQNISLGTLKNIVEKLDSNLNIQIYE